MEIKVAELLKKGVGATANFEVEESIEDIDDTGNSYDVRGEVELLRTDKGVLARGLVQTVVSCTCSRCLAPFDAHLIYRIEEEYIQTVDMVTGAHLDIPEEALFTIDEEQKIDLNEALRQSAVLALPMKPLCRPECAGICPACGADLNRERCSCRPVAVDSRWAKLEKLLSIHSD